MVGQAENGSYRTGKIIKDVISAPVENQIAAYREFSPRPAEAVLRIKRSSIPAWNAYPKFKPDSEEVYEVMLKGDAKKRRMEERKLDILF